MGRAFRPAVDVPRSSCQSDPVRLNVILIPLLLIVGGAITAVMVPLDPRLRWLIFASDVFAAVAVALLLLRQPPKR